MIQVVTQSDSAEIERPAEPWTYPYVAAVVDFGSNFRVEIPSDSGAKVGHRIVPELYFNHTEAAVIGFLDEFCTEHRLKPLFREREQNFRLEVGKRDDVRDLLRLVRPYIIAREQPVSIMLEDLIPGLEAGKHGDEAGFVELMKYVDEIRTHTTQRSEPKYTADYFRDEFGL